MLLPPSTYLTLLLLASVSEGKPGLPCSSDDPATCLRDAVGEVVRNGDVTDNKTVSDEPLRHEGKSPDGGAADSTTGGGPAFSEAAASNTAADETTDPTGNLTSLDSTPIPVDPTRGGNSAYDTTTSANDGELEEEEKKEEEEEEEEEEVTLVRKCCELDQFFSLQTQSCEAAEGDDTGFEERIHDLLAENGEVRYTSGRLQSCPGTEDVPFVSEVNFDSHSVLPAGHLREQATGINYDQEHYCLELAAGGSHELGSALLVSATCQSHLEVVTSKCCDLDQYYNYRTGDCRPKTANMSDPETLVHEFLKGNAADAASIRVTSKKVRCDQTIKAVVADEAFLDASNQLCERQTGHCYPTSLYCVEYNWAVGDSTMTPMAYVCPRDFFRKCCPRGHVLTETGCVEALDEWSVSARMRQLLEVMDFHDFDYGYPSGSRGEQCVHEWITPEDSEIRWWVSKSGYLSVDSRRKSISTSRYCVDDYLDPNNQTQAVAIMCYTELEDIVQVHLSAHPSEAASVGKCCPHSEYFSLNGYKCVQDDRGLELLQDPVLQASNVTKLTHTSFPVCESGGTYHDYYLEPGSLEDHAVLREDLVIEVVSLEGKCVLRKTPFQRNQYCLDYGVYGRDVRPLVLVCPVKWKNVHTEKFELTAVLLGLSCVGLLATAFSLVSTRVRRGLVTVKKVNTLAGRILLSYVMAHLVGFLVLAVSMKVQVTQDNTECHVLAGLLMFFLLAAFQWNTSICLESLLLTLRVSTPEGWRYFYHSLWAWGVPGLITALALTLDHYRESLPCEVITPRIGLYNCFFSHKSAKMVYLYVPMMVSLCANIVLLAAARYTRSAKLRRLEQGMARPRRPAGDKMEMKNCDQNGSTKSKEASSHQSAKAQQSGLRTHQTRNLWTESVKLVVWSGATWLLEVIGFAVTRYLVPSSENWYDYLWYLPSSVNALRGVGIFFILVLTPENRVKLSRAVGTLCSKTGISFLSRERTMTGGGCSSSVRNQRSSVSGGGTEVRDPGRRKVSNATTISQLSSIGSSLSTDSRPDTGHARATAHPRLAHSISQVVTRRSSQSSTTSSDVEGFQLDVEVGAGGRRKPSLATFGVVFLPCVDEEEVHDEAAPPTHHHPPLNTTKSTSDA